MPNLKNAIKALRQNVARAQRNQIVRDEIHSMRRAFRKQIEAKDVKAAEALLPELYKKLDKTVTKNIFKMNKVARIKSRMEANLKKAKA